MSQIVSNLWVIVVISTDAYTMNTKHTHTHTHSIVHCTHSFFLVHAIFHTRQWLVFFTDSFEQKITLASNASLINSTFSTRQIDLENISNQCNSLEG